MPETPTLPAVTFRRFVGRDDYAHMARIIDAAKVLDGDERSDTPEDVERFYSHLVRCDPATDMLFAEAEGVAIAYSRVWWDQEEKGPRTYTHICFIDPGHRGHGVGTALMTWNEARLREIAADHVAGAQVLQVFANDSNTAARALFAAFGYEPVTYEAEMVRPTVTDLPDARLPDGLEIRDVSDDQLRTIWEADAEAFRDHWGYVAPTEERYQEFLDFPYTDSSLWKVAWAGDRVAGQVRSFINVHENEEYGRKRGYTEFISTAREWRGRGVARALIVASIEEPARRGMVVAILGVPTENPNGAYQLYQSLGYEVVSSSTLYRKPL
ncbi:MAG: GNAT family N-acetyltransferase [Actinobacteria bacterium]|nr:MAG: GNAT family N-acetyltransferase [Actinomycetota bacterium]